MNIVNRFKEIFAPKKDNEYNSNVSWNDYTYRNDKRISLSSSKINDYYKGYPYKLVYTVGDFILIPPYETDFFEKAALMKNWCNTSLKGPHRIDLHRVIKQVSFINGDQVEEWIRNEISGTDIIVIAFAEEHDYVWFSIKWA
jgi:hypothetical protein